MDLKVAAAYVRVSTESQEEYSPDSQLKIIRDYAKREGYIIPDEYIFRDDGISGKSADKRPAFRLMIATAKEDNRPFEAIFVWKYSRFARNQEEAIMYKNLLRKKGVEVKSISEPSNDSPFSSLIERIIEWMDEYYLINLAGEVKRGLKEKSSRGEPTGKAPLGYTVKDKILVQNDDAETVRFIFDKYAAGLSYRQIAYALNDLGIKQPNGNAFSNQMIGYILKNPVYVGKIRWNEDGKVNYTDISYFASPDDLPDGKHEPIVSFDTWNAVQARLASKGTVKYKRVGHPVYMLKGLLRCSSCGSTLICSSSKKYSKNLKYQCYKYNSGKCKDSHFIPMNRANETVIQLLEQIIANRTFVFDVQKPKEAKPTRDWDKLITQEQTRLERAKIAMLDDALTTAEYKKIKLSIEETILKLKQAKAKDNFSEGRTIDTQAYQQRAVEVLKIIKSPDVSEEAKNSALRTIIDKIVFNKAQNTFDFYFLP